MRLLDAVCKPCNFFFFFFWYISMETFSTLGSRGPQSLEPSDTGVDSVVSITQAPDNSRFSECSGQPFEGGHT